MSEIYTYHVQKKVIDETKRLFVNILWGGCPWRVAQTTMSQRKEHDGAFELPDLDALI